MKSEKPDGEHLVLKSWLELIETDGRKYLPIKINRKFYKIELIPLEEESDKK